MTQFRILLLDTKGSNPNHYICLAIERALRGLEEVEFVKKVDLHDAISVAVNDECNLFFAFDGEELDPGICARLASACGRSVLWVTEDPYEIEVNVRNAKLFDIIFTNDSASVAAYGGKGQHLPLAGAIPFHHLALKSDPRDLRYDMFFAGTAWPNRVTLIKDLLANDWRDAGFRAKIALPTNAHLPAFELPLPASQLNWRTSAVDFAKFANMSLTTLVLPRVFSSSGVSEFAETPPPRLFEAALAGTVQLVQSNLEEARLYFEPGKEFIYFDTACDLIENLRELQARPELRADIARRAQVKALTVHCYENRVTTVLEAVKALPASDLNIGTACGSPERPRLLFVVHNIAARGHFGGVEVYLQQMAAEFKEKFEVLFWIPNELGKSAKVLLVDAQGQSLHDYPLSTHFSPWQLTCSEREQAFADALTRFDIAFVHFHHLLMHAPSLVEIAKSLGVPTAMTFHDFYAICHNFTLLSFKGSYCAPDKITTAQCDVCLWNGHHVIPGGQSSRRSFWNRVIEATDVLIFNTEGGRELASGVYPAVLEHRCVSVLPVPVLNVARRAPRTAMQYRAALKIAVIGNFTRNKGADVIARVMPLLAHSNVEFHIFGRLEGDYAWLGKQQDMPFVHVYGSYEPGSIPEALHACDVSLHLSIWPETYCLTLSEAWDCGLVPIVADIGALGERVTDGVNGLKIPPDSEGALVQAIHSLIESPGLIDRLRAGANSAPISRMEVHAPLLARIYESSIQRSALARANVEMSTFDYSRLSRPLMQQQWAVLPKVDSILAAALDHGMRRRFVDLARRASAYRQRHGVANTVRATVRYIRRRLR